MNLGFVPGETGEDQKTRQFISDGGVSTPAISQVDPVTDGDLKPKRWSSARVLLASICILSVLLAVSLIAIFLAFELGAKVDKQVFVIDEDKEAKNETISEDHMFSAIIKHTKNDGQPTIRLVDGPAYNEGRLEVFHDGRWGTVCDDGFNKISAHVACRLLGFPYAQTVYREAAFGPGDGPIWLDEVRCTGSESSLEECSWGFWGFHDCTHYEDVGVKCGLSVNIRLANGDSPREGRVEVELNGRWGTVCDDKWNQPDAEVVCRQLGYQGGHAYQGYEHPFGSGSGPIYMDNVQCTGVESALSECAFLGWENHNCGHWEDAGVRCTDGPIGPVEVRLVGGSVPNEGTVEVKYGGAWGSVCDDGWNDDAAKVVCRMLGLPSESAIALHEAYFGESSNQIWLDEVTCTGEEQNIEDCMRNDWGVHDCAHYEDAGVMCPSEPNVPDTIPPIITCPPNQSESGTILGYNDHAMYPVTFPAATATDINNNGIPTTPTISYLINGQISNNPTGQFPIGTTTVTATATDDAENTGVCSFSVTVTKVEGGPWEELANQCGLPNAVYNQRIVNGDDVDDIRRWPWAGFINNGYFCGATLISRSWAVTAAHCVHRVTSPTFLTLGVRNRGDTTSPGYHNTRTTVFEHPYYNDFTSNNDIALLKLDTPVVFNDYRKPACLTSASDEYNTYRRVSCANSANESPCCYVVGWGDLSFGAPGNEQPNILQEVRSPLVSSADCQNAYGNREITDEMVCTSTEASSGSCQGDSGGPMVCKNAQGSWDLVGVTSWGYGCGDRRYPDVLARVSRFVDWIKSTIDANGGPL